MGAINSNEELNIKGGSYPDLGFAFNPLSVVVETTKDMELKMEVSCNSSTPISVVRNTFNNKVVFDLSGIARSFFDREEFKNIEEQDKTLYKKIRFKLIVNNNPIQSEVIPVIWGAMQIGEIYKQSKQLTAFKGYPFTVPFFTTSEDGEDISYITDHSSTVIWLCNAANGKYNFDIQDLIIAANSKIKLVISKGTEYTSTFDESFDYTFRGLPIGTYYIDIDVKECNKEGYYLRWINRWGEWNYYLFHQKSESNQTTDNTVQFDQYFTSINFDDKGYHPGTGGSIGKTVKRTIGLYASLVDSDTFDFLSQVVQSPVVDLYIGESRSANMSEWMNVRTQAGTFAKSSDHLQDFELNLILPEIFTQNL